MKKKNVNIGTLRKAIKNCDIDVFTKAFDQLAPKLSNDDLVMLANQVSHEYFNTELKIINNDATTKELEIIYKKLSNQYADIITQIYNYAKKERNSSETVRINIINRTYDNKTDILYFVGCTFDEADELMKRWKGKYPFPKFILQDKNIILRPFNTKPKRPKKRSFDPFITISSSKVVVSDPWLDYRINISNVKKGVYKCFVKNFKKYNGILTVIHKDYLKKPLLWKKIGNVAVDWQMAGIFDKPSYNKDKSLVSIPIHNHHDNSCLSIWEHKINTLTMTPPYWGVYTSGVVSASGYGDGAYDVYTAKSRVGKIIGVCIDFGMCFDFGVCGDKFDLNYFLQHP